MKVDLFIYMAPMVNCIFSQTYENLYHAQKGFNFNLNVNVVHLCEITSAMTEYITELTNIIIGLNILFIYHRI